MYTHLDSVSATVMLSGNTATVETVNEEIITPDRVIYSTFTNSNGGITRVVTLMDDKHRNTPLFTGDERLDQWPPPPEWYQHAIEQMEQGE